MKSIMVVDDNEDIRESLAVILEDEGFKVDHAANGHEALKKIRREKVDVLVTDILMPQMDGIELAHEAQAIDAVSRIIFISGGGRNLDIDSDTEQQFPVKLKPDSYSVLRKPFSPLELIQAIQNM